MSENGFLLDVNILYALTARNHIHHAMVEEWFYATADLHWAICPFTEAGFLRNATAPCAGQIELIEASAISICPARCAVALRRKPASVKEQMPQRRSAVA